MINFVQVVVYALSHSNKGFVFIIFRAEGFVLIIIVCLLYLTSNALVFVQNAFVISF